MTKVILEVIKIAMHEDRLFLETSYQPLNDGEDPVAVLGDSEPNALTHSTSWRWIDNQLFLTFVQVFQDNHEFQANEFIHGSEYHDASSLPTIECHAVRHLYFLLHTDEDIAAVPNLQKFWDFAHDVVDVHHPAVAGFVGLNKH